MAAYIHPWLGVTGASLTPDLEHGTGIPMNYKGVVVTSVQPGSPKSIFNQLLLNTWVI